MRRHESLIPLTHDHHHTLAQARRLKDAHSDGDRAKMLRTADEFVNFYLGRTRRHLHEEEELFFAPLVDDDIVGPLVASAVADHLRLHGYVRELRRQLLTGDVSGELLRSTGELLEVHVRFEEQELFPLIESGIPEADLTELGTTGRRDI